MLGELCLMVLVHTLVSEVIQVSHHWSILTITVLTIVLLGYGGFGFTSRMWGLTLDTIKSINMVLANGSIITASSTQHSDIFWVCSYFIQHFTFLIINVRR
jgi:hypothetical protein